MHVDTEVVPSLASACVDTCLYVFYIFTHRLDQVTDMFAIKLCYRVFSDVQLGWFKDNTWGVTHTEPYRGAQD